MQLPNKSLEFLRDVLAAPGWVKGDSAARKVKFAYEAGQLLSEVLPEPTGAPLPPDKDSGPLAARLHKEACAKWDPELSTPDFTLTTRQTEVCRMALLHFLETDSIPKGRFANLLVDQFKVLED